MKNFLKYPSIENKVALPDDSSGVYVATEKLHGCNFQLTFDTKKIQACRRKGPLNPGEKFYNYQEIVERYRTAIESIGEETGPFKIYGELFGGNVQKEIYYQKDVDFIAFDIFYQDRFMDFDKLQEICQKNGIPVVPVLMKGSFVDCVKFNIESIETVVGTKENPDNRNRIIEGIVVRPMKEPKQSVETDWFCDVTNRANDVDHRVRNTFKIKTEKFSEKHGHSKVKVVDIDPDVTSRNYDVAIQLSQLMEYLNVNRFNAVKSKELPIEGMKEVKKYINLMVEDITKDFPESNNFSKTTMGKFNGIVGKFVSTQIKESMK